MRGWKFPGGPDVRTFEEDGAFKAGTILVDNDNSLQVKPPGKRVKAQGQPCADALSRSRRRRPCWTVPMAESEGLDVEFL